jgi:hypothetical protein
LQILIVSLNINKAFVVKLKMILKRLMLLVTGLLGLAIGDNLKAQVNAICQNISVNLNSMGGKTISGTEVDNNSTSSCGTISSYTVYPNTFNCSNAGSTIAVTLTVTNSCSQLATCTALVDLLDTLSRVNLTKIPALVCQSDFDIILNAAPTGGIWTSNKTGTISGKRFTPSTSPTGVPIKILYYYTDPSNNCKARDSMYTRVEALPEVEIITKDVDLCRTETMSLMVNAQIKNTSGLTWSSLTPGTQHNNHMEFLHIRRQQRDTIAVRANTAGPGMPFH